MWLYRSVAKDIKWQGIYRLKYKYDVPLIILRIEKHNEVIQTYVLKNLTNEIIKSESLKPVNVKYCIDKNTMKLGDMFLKSNTWFIFLTDNILLKKDVKI